MSPHKIPVSQRLARPGVRSLRIGTALVCLAVYLGGAASARPQLDESTEKLLVEAVEAAAALDYYEARCRSDDSGRRTDNLNKELASKLRITVLTVEDDLFPERNYRTVRERLQAQFAEALREAGGCKAAKDGGMPERLGARYDELIAAIEALP